MERELQRDYITRMVREFLLLPILFRSRFTKPFNKNIDMPPMQAATLRMLETCGTCNMTTLSRAVAVSSQQLSRIIDSLVKRGLVSRSENPESRRELLISLTGEGTALLRDFERCAADELVPFFESLSDGERKELLSALKTIHHLINQGRERCPKEE